MLLSVASPMGILVAGDLPSLRGRVSAPDQEAVSFASIAVKGGRTGCVADATGAYELNLPQGRYTLIISSVGYKKQYLEVELGDTPRELNITLQPDARLLGSVEVVARGVARLRGTAYNAVSIDSRELLSSNKTLGEALSRAPGVKVRETGGVGSDMNVSLDGFSGRHVKVFVDGVPQEGAGRAFGLNNIPVSYAERIEVYRGVVPVDFGADAIGGVINIVTSRKHRPWYVDASYSFGSYQTHRSTLSVGRTERSGLTYELSAYQNYSKNNYWVDTPVEDLVQGFIDTSRPEHVRRFHDTYHNEALTGKVGLVRQSWADRLLLHLRYARVYKEIQTGVRQEIVFGERHRHGYSLTPTLEYAKTGMLEGRMDVRATASYTRSASTLVDTSEYRYNWRGERSLRNSPGEQSYGRFRSEQGVWTAGLSLKYRPSSAYTLLLHHNLSTFDRSMTDLSTRHRTTSPFPDREMKNITGLSLQYRPDEVWDATLFAKSYAHHITSSIAQTGLQGSYVEISRSSHSLGYGVALSSHPLRELQIKLSYEKAYRLPTSDEIFGDTDLESGTIGLKPENSHNLNLNVNWSRRLSHHTMLLVEGGLIWRDTRDYIQRNVQGIGGNNWGAVYINYGRVLTKGANLSVRLDYQKWLSLGGSYTLMDVRDNQPLVPGGQVANVGYGLRMPNLPYSFGSLDLTLRRKGLLGQGTMASLSYDGQYLHSFAFYSEGIGAGARNFFVPTQLSHSLTATLSFAHDRYALSLECRNLTDARLYDNYSLQKAGRALYAKLRIHLGH